MPKEYKQTVFCEIDKCKSKSVIYGYPQYQRCRCRKHKLPNMINLVSKRCEKYDCNKIPIFGYVGTKKGIYCKLHTTAEMVDVKNKKCQYVEEQPNGVKIKCVTDPSYSMPSIKSPTHCAIHRTPEMIIKFSRRCKTERCTKISCFGYNGRETHCILHAEPNMKCGKSHQCVFCENYATYREIASGKKFCVLHCDFAKVEKGEIVSKNLL